MKTLMEELGDALLNCSTAGILITMLLDLLGRGALNEAVQSFMESIC